MAIKAKIYPEIRIVITSYSIHYTKLYEMPYPFLEPVNVASQARLVGGGPLFQPLQPDIQISKLPSQLIKRLGRRCPLLPASYNFV